MITRARAWIGVLALALGLRLMRAIARWDEVNWLYTAYPADTVDALSSGAIGTALSGWMGLHPPLFPLLHALMELWLPRPALFLLFSVACSTTAVLLLARRAPLAGLLLACSPIQLAYAAEINNYPMVSLWIAAIWLARERSASGGPWWPLALVGVLGSWTHLLVGFVGGVAALTLARPQATRVLGVMAIASLPLLPGAWELLQDQGTYRQPPFKADLVFGDFVDRFGLLSLGTLPALILGIRRAPALALGTLATAALILGLVAGGIAAPHQFLYLVSLGPPIALLIAAGATTRPLQGLVCGVALLQGCWIGAFNGMRLLDLRDDAPRAIDSALERLERPWSCEATQPPDPSCTGDALYLLAPAGTNDDDKRKTSAVLWRLAPWRAMPMVQPYPFRYADYRHGQPRLFRGHVVYVNDQVRDTLPAAIAAHDRLLVVVYEQGQREAFNQSLADRLGSSPQRIGPDLLFEVGAGVTTKP